MSIKEYVDVKNQNIVNFRKNLLLIADILFLFIILFLFNIILIIVQLEPILRILFALPFLFIPGYFMLEFFYLIEYSLIEKVILSFGLSLGLIFVFTYCLFNIVGDNIIISYFFVCIILFVISSIKRIIYNKTKFVNWNIHNYKYDIFICSLSFIFFICQLIVRSSTFLRFPDEYLYYNNAFKFSHINLLDKYALYNAFFKKRILFIIIIKFFQDLGVYSINTLHAISLFFYSMLFIPTYMIGNMIYNNRKIGILSSLFILSNPFILYWSSRLMPDILLTVLSLVSFYFFYKSFEKTEIIKWQYLIPSIIFFALALITKISVSLFVIPFTIYAVIFLINKRELIKIIIAIGIPIFFIGFFIYLHPSILNKDLVIWINSFLSIFSYNLKDWNKFLFKSTYGGAWNVWVYPYYYTHPICVLILIGSYFSLKTISKRKNILIFLSILFYLIFFSTVKSAQDPRNMMPCYPLFMILSSVGLLFNKDIFQIIILILSFLVLFPQNNYTALFGNLPESWTYISKITAFSTILFKLIQTLNKYFLNIKIKLKFILNWRNEIEK